MNKLVLQLFKRPLLQETFYTMAAKLDLPGISRFDPDVEHSSIGPRWQAWREELDYYIAAANITNDKQKRNLLLHLAGPKVQNIFKTLREPGEERTFKSASDVLDGYFLPKKNVVYELFWRSCARTARVN